MTLSQIMNHGKRRWRINIQYGDFRKRLLFERESEAVAFLKATRGTWKYAASVPRRGFQHASDTIQRLGFQ